MSKRSINCSAPEWVIDCLATDIWSRSDRSFTQKVGRNAPIDVSVGVDAEYVDRNGIPDGVTVDSVESRVAYLIVNPLRGRPRWRKHDW